MTIFRTTMAIHSVGHISGMLLLLPRLYILQIPGKA
jgi:hypothetical protein